jgi:hypothetical protein
MQSASGYDTLKLVGMGVAQQVESAVRAPVDLVTSIAAFKARNGFAVTRRGILSYLANFRLGASDLAGKHILDLGSGRSRFAQTLNDLLAAQGTVAVGVDRFAKPPTAKSPRFVTTDAFKLPFRPGSFDLVLSNWFFCLFMPDVTAPRFTAEKRKRLDLLVDQVVNVLAPGGEARVSYSVLHLGLGGVPYVRDRLRAHPDVALVEVKRPLPWMGYIRAVRRT